MIRPRPVLLAWWIWAVLITAVLAFASCQVRASVAFDCRQLAELIERVSSYRDAGADLEKTIVVVRRLVDYPAQHFAALEREIRRMWRDGLPADLVPQRTFDRCRDRLGDMGLES